MKDNERFPAPPNARQGLGVVVPIRPSAPGAKRPDVDWDRVEAQYRAGILTLREIGAEHSISHTAVDKRAASRGWVRDLQAKIKAAAQALVDRAQVSDEVAKVRQSTDREVVQSNAAAIAEVVLRQRSDVTEAIRLVKGMLSELHELCANVKALEAIVTELAQAEYIGKDQAKRLLEATTRTVSLPSRAAVMKTLTDCLTKLIDSERTIWRIDTHGGNSAAEPKKAPDMASIAPEEAAQAYLDWASSPTS